MRVRFVLAAAGLVAAAGCSSGGSASPAGPAAAAPTTDVVAACSALFADGKPTPAAPATGYTSLPCSNRFGDLFQVQAFRCKNGRLLWAIGTYAPTPGWGFAGQAFHAAKTDFAGSPAYKRAYTACLN